MTGTPGADQPSFPEQVWLRSQLWTNSAGQLAGALLARLSRAGGILLAARFLGPESFGVVATGLAAYEMLRVATEAGLDTRLIRRVARDPAAGRQEMRRTIRVKARIATAVLAVVVLVAGLAGGRASASATAALAIGVFGMAVAGSVQALATAQLEAPRLLPYQAAAGILFFSAVTTTAVLTRSAVTTALAIGVSDLLGGWVQAWYARGHPSGDRAPATWSARQALSESWPVGAVNLLATAYGRLGVGVLAFTWGAAAVAQYGVSYRVVEAFLMAAAAISASAFAVTARLDTAAPDQAHDLLNHILARVSLITLVIAAVVAGGAVMLPQVLGQRYQAAVGTTQVLAFALPPMFLNGLLTAHLYGRGRFTTVMRIGMVNLIINAALVAALIPLAGPPGAALAMVGTESANTFWQSRAAGLGSRAWTWWIAALCAGAGVAVFLLQGGEIR